ncbi:MAG: matrixin family metalloprotease [Deltaproteobacteria bacterium]|nr:matrixin family metalloprotease [Deltaproteobacteria bacterium]
MLRLALLFLVCFLCSKAHAFVLLSGPAEATLPATETSPTITFQWDGNVPSLKDIDEVLDGRWKNLSDNDVMEQALLFALNVWSEVPGSFLKLSLQTSPGAEISDQDHIYSIVVKQDKNLTTSAFAVPRVEGEMIVDCDISISDKTHSLNSLVYTLIHELGHCIGLGHNHTNYGALMGYSRYTRSLRLGADDMAGLIYLYPDSTYDGEVNDLYGCGRAGNVAKASPVSRFFIYLALFFPLAVPTWKPRRSRKRPLRK